MVGELGALGAARVGGVGKEEEHVGGLAGFVFELAGFTGSSAAAFGVQMPDFFVGDDGFDKAVHIGLAIGGVSQHGKMKWVGTWIRSLISAQDGADLKDGTDFRGCLSERAVSRCLPDRRSYAMNRSRSAKDRPLDAL